MINTVIRLVPAALLFLSANTLFASELTVESRIAGVTVYPDSTLINREAKLKLDSGEYKILLSNIIPEIDENSLRVSAQGGAEFKLFGAQLKREYLEGAPSENIKELQQKIQATEDEIKQAQNLQNVLSEEKNFLDSIRLFSHDQIPKDLVTNMPGTKMLDDSLKFLVEKLKDNYAQSLSTEFKIRDLTNKVNALKQELSGISGPVKKIKRSIVVDLEILKTGTLDLNVSYLAQGASWQPIYDARASFEKNQVELVSYGIVRQTTGEDWENVEISLSTAKPALGGRMPYVSPWFLRPYQPQTQGWGRAKSMTLRVGKESNLQSEAFDELKNIAAPQETYARPQERGISVVYKLSRRVTVKSDGSEYKLPVSSQVLQVKFAYSTYPRISTYAYLGSRVTNAKELQLLAGRVNIFLEGEFVGTSSIDNIAPGEEFDLYLGVDENVKVKRELIEKKVDNVFIAGIPSTTEKITFKYKTTIENYKGRKAGVILFEAVPVSEDERIKVKINNVGLEPKEKDWQKRKGVWRWELELEPKAKKEIVYTYTIEYPRDMQVEGL